MKKWIVPIVVVLLALSAYVAVGPYLTVRAIRSAIQQQDHTALSQQVDFPLLRASLKLQLQDRLVRKAGTDLQANPFAAIGLSIAGGVINGAVDAMVTPLGLGAMMEGRKVWKRFDDGLSSSGSAVATPQQPLHDAKYRYQSLSRFTATVQDDSDRPLVFVLTRDGVRWKLSDIRLPLEPD